MVVAGLEGGRWACRRRGEASVGGAGRDVGVVGAGVGVVESEIAFEDIWRLKLLPLWGTSSDSTRVEGFVAAGGGETAMGGT